MPPTPSDIVVAVQAAAPVPSACATALPYHAASLTDAAQEDGYRELPVGRERSRAVFVGESLTSRETVETYLPYRAAGLTLQNGHDGFQAVEDRIIRPEN